MAGTVDRRLQELGISLPSGPAPVANYVPYVVHGKLVFVSGQVPFVDGKLAFVGTVGSTLALEDGQAAARTCAINILAQVKAACGGDLDRVTQCVRLGGYVNATPEFRQHPQVVNGASDLMVAVFGDRGRHARFAVGAGSLPGGAAVEIEGIFEIA
ncbi:MAG: RidA family protein [Alphaproteobacteria bacterium]|nr:RidA family protein [Alphaproteobacteria bacterium]